MAAVIRSGAVEAAPTRLASARADGTIAHAVAAAVERAAAPRALGASPAGVAPAAARGADAVARAIASAHLAAAVGASKAMFAHTRRVPTRTHAGHALATARAWLAIEPPWAWAPVGDGAIDAAEARTTQALGLAIDAHGALAIARAVVRARILGAVDAATRANAEARALVADAGAAAPSHASLVSRQRAIGPCPALIACAGACVALTVLGAVARTGLDGAAWTLPAELANAPALVTTAVTRAALRTRGDVACGSAPLSGARTLAGRQIAHAARRAVTWAAPHLAALSTPAMLACAQPLDTLTMLTASHGRGARAEASAKLARRAVVAGLAKARAVSSADAVRLAATGAAALVTRDAAPTSLAAAHHAAAIEASAARAVHTLGWARGFCALRATPTLVTPTVARGRVAHSVPAAAKRTAPPLARRPEPAGTAEALAIVAHTARCDLACDERRSGAAVRSARAL